MRLHPPAHSLSPLLVLVVLVPSFSLLPDLDQELGEEDEEGGAEIFSRNLLIDLKNQIDLEERPGSQHLCLRFFHWLAAEAEAAGCDLPL